jgi:AcrR family transcriptional regulator
MAVHILARRGHRLQYIQEGRKMPARSVRNVAEDKDPELVAKRRGQLIQAAIAAFSRVGYHAATVKDVADAAGVSAGLIYQYMSDKHDLLFLCLMHIVERNKEEIPAALKEVNDPMKRLHAAVEAYSRVIAANPSAVQLTYRESKSLKREHIESLKVMELETNTLLANCIDECIRAGLLSSMNVEPLVYRIITAAHAWDLKHWRLSKIVSLDEYLSESVHANWTAYLTVKGKRRWIECTSPTRQAAAIPTPAVVRTRVPDLSA